jgi:hypothetical protein
MSYRELVDRFGAGLGPDKVREVVGGSGRDRVIDRGLSERNMAVEERNPGS